MLNMKLDEKNSLKKALLHKRKSDKKTVLERKILTFPLRDTKIANLEIHENLEIGDFKPDILAINKPKFGDGLFFYEAHIIHCTNKATTIDSVEEAMRNQNILRNYMTKNRVAKKLISSKLIRIKTHIIGTGVTWNSTHFHTVGCIQNHASMLYTHECSFNIEKGLEIKSYSNCDLRTELDKQEDFEKLFHGWTKDLRNRKKALAKRLRKKVSKKTDSVPEEV